MAKLKVLKLDLSRVAHSKQWMPAEEQDRAEELAVGRVLGAPGTGEPRTSLYYSAGIGGMAEEA